jgi:hypothetical protein
MVKKIFLRNLLPVAAGMVLLSGCIVEQPAPGPEAPPPPRAEVVPAQPDLTFVWTPGFWDWQGRWVWVHGYWGPRPHPGAVWVQGGWVHRHRGYMWAHPHWQ